jgi:DNA polymerase sigma
MPIITLRTRATLPDMLAVCLDISFQNENHFGVETNKLVASLQHEHRMLRPLVLVLKQFLRERGLGKGFSGGLVGVTSFAFV